MPTRDDDNNSPSLLTGPSAPRAPRPGPGPSDQAGRGGGDSSDGGGSSRGDTPSGFVDKNNFVPQVELPRGGGSIRGLGEKFQPNPFTGTGGFSVPLAASPGRQGFGPALTMGYSSGGGNTAFGFGWSVDVPSVSRRTDRGLPEYRDSEESDTFILSGAEDLVPELDANGEIVRREGTVVNNNDHSVIRYRPRVEGLFARIERWTKRDDGDIHWRSISRDNVTSWFGRSSASRIENPDNDRQVFRWLLEESRDDRGNVIVYEYKAEDALGVDTNAIYEENRIAGPGGVPTAQRYLKRVKYGNDMPGMAADFKFELVMDYGEHGTATNIGTVEDPIWELEVSPAEDRDWLARADAFSTHRPGFEVRTHRLLRRTLMFHHFSELNPAGQEANPPVPYLVASTVMTHEETPAASFVNAITQFAYERNDANMRFLQAGWPELVFGYTKPQIDQTVRTLDDETLENLPQGVDGGLYRFVDLDGEGLPGILTEQAGQWFYKPGEGEGRFGPVVALPQQPSTANLGGGFQQLVDLDGGGAKQLVQYVAPTPGFFERAEDCSWEGFRAFETIPNIDYRDPNLTFLDLDGDGYPDIMVAKDDHFVWYRSRQTKGFEAPRIVPKPKHERAGAALIFQELTRSIFFADMSGDGLSDIVRVRNAEVCYWPNLGYGRFGRKVTLADSPVMDTHDLFDAARVRLADVDGTGPSDIIYLGTKGAKIWLNQAGNSLGQEVHVRTFPLLDDVSNVEVVDLLGKGTAALVWSSALPTDARQRVRYIDLMGGPKPHLLESVDNRRGMLTKVRYAPSTKFYIADKKAGRPWATKLPFPVQVVVRSEAFDQLRKQQFVQHFAYHHGYFDKVEREFRGFGMVEQWDTESFDAFGLPPGQSQPLFEFENPFAGQVEDNLHQPPILTRSWFHTGAYIGWERASRVFEGEYWVAEDHGGVSRSLPESVLPDTMTADERREAQRALGGRVLRTEVYALDGTDAEILPYAVTDANFEIKLLQPRHDNSHAVFFVHARETLASAYERNPADPRFGHSFVLEVGEFGTVLRSADVAYPRVVAPDPDKLEQAKLHATLAENTVAHTPVTETAAADDDYRVGVPISAKAYELHNLPDAAGDLYVFDDLLEHADLAAEIDFEVAPALPTDPPEPPPPIQKRRLSFSRTFYYDDSGPNPDFSTAPALPLGMFGTRAIVFHSDVQAFTNAQFTSVFAGVSQDMPDAALLTGEGKYVLDGSDWFVRSGRSVPNAQEFFLAVEGIDPYGESYTVTYDPHHLFVTQTADPVGNTSTAEHNYRVLAPRRLVGANGNASEVVFDTRGLVIATAVIGKNGEGDTLTAPDYLDATARVEYDLFAWADREEPNFSRSIAREQHANPSSPTQQSYTYVDGAGAVLMSKVQAEPGLAPQRDANGDLVLDGGGEPVLVDTSPALRWVGNGRTILNNKGNPVKQYEPYFSSTFAYEDEAELVEQGVTPVISYDPLGRVTRTDFPDGTFATVEFDSWSQTSFDANDNISFMIPGPGAPIEVQSEWAQERIALGSGAEFDAWFRSKDHANTPTRVHLDSLGRTFLSIADNGAGVTFETTSTLDIQGNVLAVKDARDNIAEERVYAMLGQSLKVTSIDAGDRYAIANVLGDPLRGWDDLGRVKRVTYDTLRRRLERFVKDSAGTELLREKIFYGDTPGLTGYDNALGRVVRMWDGGGEASTPGYDFKGNALSQARRLVAVATAEPDWSALAGLDTEAAIDTALAGLLEATSYTATSTYDALNRMETATGPDLSVQTYAYNEAALLESVELVHRGTGTPTLVVSGIDYDAKGQRQTVSYANGTTTTYAYDEKTFRVRNILTLRGTTKLQDLIYTYDPVGNITRVQDDAQQTVYFLNSLILPHSDYTYDAVYRLVTATGREQASPSLPVGADLMPGVSVPDTDPNALARYTETYEYDAVGNILKVQHTNGAGTDEWTRFYDYAGDGNRLLSTSAPGEGETDPHTHTYGYDAHGNMTSMPGLATMVWNDNDELRQAPAGSGTVYFQYAGGQRIRKFVETTGVMTKERIYLGGWEVYRERANGVDVSEETATLHVSDDVERVLMVEEKTIGTATGTYWRYQLSNHLGSASAELDENGIVFSYEEFHPFGTSAYRAHDSTLSGASPRRYRFTGMERDEETGLAYHGARYYAPWLGRWTAADPIGLGDGVNRYSYVAGSPTTLADPSGMAPPVEPAKQRTDPLASAGSGGLGPRRPVVLIVYGNRENSRPGTGHRTTPREQAGGFFKAAQSSADAAREQFGDEVEVVVVQAATGDEFFDALTSVNGPIQRLEIYSHGWPNGINFGGYPGIEDTEDNVNLRRVTQDRDFKDKPDLAGLFAPGATCLLAGCDVGAQNGSDVHPSIAQKFADEFSIEVEGATSSTDFRKSTADVTRMDPLNGPRAFFFPDVEKIRDGLVLAETKVNNLEVDADAAAGDAFALAKAKLSGTDGERLEELRAQFESSVEAFRTSTEAAETAVSFVENRAEDLSDDERARIEQLRSTVEQLRIRE